MSGERSSRVVFLDSGIGGLSIYRASRSLLKNASVVYVLDNQYFPYGEKSPEDLILRVSGLVFRLQTMFPIRLFILSCNTATVETIHSLRKAFSFPIVGVEPAFKSAARSLPYGGVIGLLATDRTLASRFIRERACLYEKTHQIKYLRGQPLVPMVERIMRGESVSDREFSSVLEPWLHFLESPSKILLGCTHFPLILDRLQGMFPHNKQLFIDNTEAIGRRVAALYKESFTERTSCAASSQCQHMALFTRRDDASVRLRSLLQREGFSLFSYL